MKHQNSRAARWLLKNVQRSGVESAMRQVYIDARVRQGKRDRLLARLRERWEARRNERI